MAVKLSLVCALALVVASAAAAAAEPPKSGPGPLAAETVDELIVRDPAGKKAVPCKAHFPKTGGPYPVIVFSHGFGGNKDAFGPVGKHWASHGYVVIHPSHADGVGRARREPAKPAKADDADPARADTVKADPAEAKADESVPGRPRPGGLAGGFFGGLNDPQKIGGRVGDVTLILDALDHLPRTVPALAGKIDKDRVGVGGHSFGAYTAMLVGGVTADLGGQRDRSYLDKRVRCILPISAQGTGQQGLTAKSWEQLKLPMMTITGTRDRGAGGQGLDWKTEPYQHSPPGDKYLVVIEGANHVSFGGGLGARGADIVACVELASTHFWDAYLKDSAAAKEYLQAGQLAEDTNGKCTFEKK